MRILFPTFRRVFSACIFLSVFLSFFVATAVSEEILWQTIATDRTVIKYQSEEDLAKFDRKIRFGSREWGLKQLFDKGDTLGAQEKLKKKIDSLFERIQEILDMRRRVKPVTIYVYHDRKQLDAAFFAIYKKKSRIRAWYRFRNNAVYINADDMHEGMLAHELAHAVIDNYLKVKPPAATAEILARYVDTHLKR